MEHNDNNELEIDFVAWLNVLKKHLAFIIGITLLFTAAAVRHLQDASMYHHSVKKVKQA